MDIREELNDLIDALRPGVARGDLRAMEATQRALEKLAATYGVEA